MHNSGSRSIEGKVLKGCFYDSPVQGLEYETRTFAGMTDDKGTFEYLHGETITFSIGGLVLGTAFGKELVTPLDLAIDADGRIERLKIKKVTNIARFLQSLSSNIEEGIKITAESRNIIKAYRYGINFDQSEDDFTADPNIKELFDKIKTKLRSPAAARNHLRRTLSGIRRMKDVKIPTRDGSYLFADVYLPIKEGRYPAIVGLGGHGKVLLGAMGKSYTNSEEDVETFERTEDAFFEGNPEGLAYVENHGCANTTDWIKEGYALVKVDERGTGYSPGLFEQFSLQEAKDFYDSIEWSAKQSWCDGNVGTWGFSYWGITQWNMAQLQPPSLKAMVPAYGSVDSYRDYTYNGGILNSSTHVCKLSAGEWKGIDWPQIAIENPFCDPDIYGPQGKSTISPDLSKINVPLWCVMPLEYFSINIRGSSEGYIGSASENKKLTIAGDHWGAYPYCQHAFDDHLAFFDYWLKGIDNGIMDQSPVKMMIRTGGGGYFWQIEDEWPIARTKYIKYYLNAAPSSWKGDGLRNDFMKMGTEVPKDEKKSTYFAEINEEVEKPWSHGISFITDPLEEDVMLAGYIKLGLWVSSTSCDMDIVADIRVMEENGSEVPYAMTYTYSGMHHPISIGWQKVSHRKTDPEKSTVYRPWHTHLEEDCQPLKPGEIVPVEVEIWPATAFVKKGNRIRLDIQPADGHDHPCPHIFDLSYHKGALNTLYTGMDHPSYLQLPVIPEK